MFDVLKEILVRDIKVPAERLTMAATREEISLDSLATVELSVLLEREMGIKISEEELNDVANVGDIVALMEQRAATV